MKPVRAALVVLGIALPLLAASPADPAGGSAPCSFGRGSPIPESSAWLDQFKCYQASGRHVSVVGSGSFDAGTVSGGICIAGVAHDRAQVAACGSFAGDGAMILPYSAIGYVIDDSRSEVVNIYLSPLFHR
ncbi:MAG: hypothetical protein SGJ01_14830 [Gemmatimonadota bacterium]|nr:hypothetical protein [Gemmatimonadota bacterium]